MNKKVLQVIGVAVAAYSAVSLLYFGFNPTSIYTIASVAGFALGLALIIWKS